MSTSGRRAWDRASGSSRSGVNERRTRRGGAADSSPGTGASHRRLPGPPPEPTSARPRLPGSPRWTGSERTPTLRTRATTDANPRGWVEAHRRREVARIPLLLPQRGEQDLLRDRGMPLRIAGHANSLEGMSELIHQPEQCEAVLHRGSVFCISTHHERVAYLGRRAPPSNSARRARLRTTCAARCDPPTTMRDESFSTA